MPLNQEFLTLLQKKHYDDADYHKLETLATLIREQILKVVSSNGGHLSSTLGAVELIIGMHAVFDIERDPFIFDVSHQAYAHKLLTNRWDDFHSLRQTNGISGFTNPKESPYDYFIAGHSSTSISLGIGAAKAIALNKSQKIPVVLIGDGAMSAGLAYEALNELGDRKYPMVIILNDNEMSIAKPIGAISKYLSQIIAGKFFQNIKQKLSQVMNNMPNATYLAKRFEDSLKLITPGMLFEELGLDYIGPIDGHDLKEIILTLHIAKEMGKPVVIHAQTLKGKGYSPAEGHLEQWHGVNPFDVKEAAFKPKQKTTPSPTEVFANHLLSLAQNDPKVVGVTAAMPSGTGLDLLMKHFPERFWDVAIAEQHAITQSSALAKEGFKPFVAIYSTFLQRGYDQIIHDVGIMNTPVKFAIDRAGIVGEDGETHQGVFDVGFFNLIPNFTLFAPRDNATLKEAINFAHGFSDGPCAFRYPRKAFKLQEEQFPSAPFCYGKLEILHNSPHQALLVGYGNGVGRAHLCNEQLQKHLGQCLSLVDLRFLKPLDKHALHLLAKEHPLWFVFSDNAKIGGIAQSLLFLKEQHQQLQIISFEFDDAFIPHGKVEEIEAKFGYDTHTLTHKILSIINSQGY